MLLKLQQYDVELVYVRSQHMYIADTLSRAYLQDTSSSDDQETVHMIDHRSVFEQTLEDINMMDSLPVSDATLQKFQAATNADQGLQTTKSLILHGWPDKSQVPHVA